MNITTDNIGIGFLSHCHLDRFGGGTVGGIVGRVVGGYFLGLTVVGWAGAG